VKRRRHQDRRREMQEAIADESEQSSCNHALVDRGGVVTALGSQDWRSGGAITLNCKTRADGPC
jgi:hypothetical protein